MAYLLFLFVSVAYLSVLNRYKPVRFGTLLWYGLPVIVLWVLLIGGQYGVGTDYFDYMERFRSGDMDYVRENRGEVLFSGFVTALLNIGIKGQGIFIALSLFWVILLLKIMHLYAGSKWLYLFLFVFIVFPGMFNNQMNGLRQYTAIYVLTLGVCFLVGRRYLWAAVLSVCSVFFHKSAALIIPALLVMHFLAGRIRPLWLVVSVFAGIAVSFLTTPELVMRLLLLSSDGEMYAHYLDSDLFKPHPLSVRLPKYICMPLYFAAVCVFRKESSLSQCDKRLFVIGVLGYAMKLATLSFGMVHRIGLYFDILACIPLVYLLIWLYRNKRISCYAMMAYMLVPYLVKVLVSTGGEYSYDSFLLHR